MSEQYQTVASERAGEGSKCPLFPGLLGLLRYKFGELSTPGQSLAKGLEEIRATRPTLGDIAEGIDAGLNHAATVHAEHEPTYADWEFPPKDLGFMDRDDPRSTYYGRDN